MKSPREKGPVTTIESGGVWTLRAFEKFLCCTYWANLCFGRISCDIDRKNGAKGIGSVNSTLELSMALTRAFFPLKTNISREEFGLIESLYTRLLKVNSTS